MIPTPRTLMASMMCARNCSQRPPVFTSIWEVRLRALDAFLDWPATVHINDVDNLTGLLRCVIGPFVNEADVTDFFDYQQVVRPILRKRPDVVSAIDTAGCNLLHVRAAMCIKNGPRTLLFDAAAYAYPAALMMKDNAGDTPVHIAAKTVSAQAISVLKVYLAACPEATMVANAKGRLPLHVAVDALQGTCGSDEGSAREASKAALLIYTYGPDAIKEWDADRRTVLHYAARLERSCLLRMLLALWPQGAAARDNAGRTPWFDALQSTDYRLMLAALEAADPGGFKTADNEGVTLLHAAAMDDRVDILQHLLQGYPGIGTVDTQGRTLLHAAVEAGALQAYRYLLQKYPSTAATVDKQGRTLLQVAVAHHHPEILAELLLAHRFEPRNATGNIVTSTKRLRECPLNPRKKQRVDSVIPAERARSTRKKRYRGKRGRHEVDTDASGIAAGEGSMGGAF